MRRAATVFLLLSLALCLALVLKKPIQRLHAVILLYKEELHPPLLVPVQGVSPSSLTGSWGASRSGGRHHEGIDIFAPCGTPVVSATHGFVSSLGHNKLGGQVVWVLGPGGTWHYYAHLSRFATLTRWEPVQPGDVLGYVGHTGNAAGTSCHLHYGIYLNGKAHDPYPYLAPSKGKTPTTF